MAELNPQYEFGEHVAFLAVEDTRPPIVASGTIVRTPANGSEFYCIVIDPETRPEGNETVEWYCRESEISGTVPGGMSRLEVEQWLAS